LKGVLHGSRTLESEELGDQRIGRVREQVLTISLGGLTQENAAAHQDGQAMFHWLR
jgi:hypothetical protein